MPYADVSQYVLASVAIPEIARCYFGGDTNKAESDARIAAQEGALPVFRDTPFLHINRERWHNDHIHWSSIFDPLYFPRADLLKIYPDLWRSLQYRSSGRYSGHALRTWYKDWLAENLKLGKIPTRKDEWQAAKNAVSENVPRDAVRALRKKFAPETWKKQGRRKGT